MVSDFFDSKVLHMNARQAQHHLKEILESQEHRPVEDAEAEITNDFIPELIKQMEGYEAELNKRTPELKQPSQELMTETLRVITIAQDICYRDGLINIAKALAALRYRWATTLGKKIYHMPEPEQKPTRRPWERLGFEAVNDIRESFDRGEDRMSIARRHMVNLGTVYQIGRRKSHVSGT